MMLNEELEQELLDNAGVLNVALRRDEVSQLVLSIDRVPPISAQFDLRDATAWGLIRDAMMRLTNPDDEVIRVIGNPVQQAGLVIDVTLPTAPLRAAMIDYGLRILLLSAVISVITAALLFFAARRVVVLPIRRVISQCAPIPRRRKMPRGSSSPLPGSRNCAMRRRRCASCRRS